MLFTLAFGCTNIIASPLLPGDNKSTPFYQEDFLFQTLIKVEIVLFALYSENKHYIPGPLFIMSICKTPSHKYIASKMKMEDFFHLYRTSKLILFVLGFCQAFQTPLPIFSDFF